MDGVVQQTLEPALERPALLHQRLIAGDDKGDSRSRYSFTSVCARGQGLR